MLTDSPKCLFFVLRIFVEEKKWTFLKTELQTTTVTRVTRQLGNGKIVPTPSLEEIKALYDNLVRIFIWYIRL